MSASFIPPSERDSSLISRMRAWVCLLNERSRHLWNRAECDKDLGHEPHREVCGMPRALINGVNNLL